jgi:hypothetical protein
MMNDELRIQGCFPLRVFSGSCFAIGRKWPHAYQTAKEPGTTQNYYSFVNNLHFPFPPPALPPAGRGLNYFFALEVINDEFCDLRLI